MGVEVSTTCLLTSLSSSNHAWLANFIWRRYLGVPWSLIYLTSSTSWSHLVTVNTWFSSDNYVIFFSFVALLVRVAKGIHSTAKLKQGEELKDRRFSRIWYKLPPLEQSFNFIHIESRTFTFLNSKLRI